MTVSHRVSSQTIAGGLGGFVSEDMAFATIEGSFNITRLDLRLTDAPAGGTVVAMVNTVAGGGGSALLQGTVLDTTKFISVIGSIPVAGTTTLYLRLVSESGGALGLSASVELSFVDGGTVTLLLSTLQNVKDSAAVEGSTHDAVLQRHLEGVSKAMQKWMGQNISSIVVVGERHFPTGLSEFVGVDEGPIISIEEIRSAGIIQETDTYRMGGGRLITRVSGEYRKKWLRNAEIEVDYTAGYAVVPADLVEACTMETVRRWSQTLPGGGPGPHVTSLTPEVGDTIAFSGTGFLSTTIQAMTPYRKFQ